MDVTELGGLKRTPEVDDQQGQDGAGEPGSREPIFRCHGLHGLI